SATAPFRQSMTMQKPGKPSSSVSTSTRRIGHGKRRVMKQSRSAFALLRITTAARWKLTLAAVITGENDDCVVGDPRNFQSLQHTADLQIHLPYHASVSFQRAAVVMRKSANALRLCFITRRFLWPMRRVEVETDEEGLPGFCIGIDCRNGAVADQVCQISGLVHLELAIPQIVGIGVGWSRFVCEIIEGTAAKAPEVVVAALEGTEIGQPAEMPFSNQRSAVAGLL